MISKPEEWRSKEFGMKGESGFMWRTKKFLLLVFSVPVTVPSTQCQLRTHTLFYKTQMVVKHVTQSQFDYLDSLVGGDWPLTCWIWITFTTNIPFVDWALSDCCTCGVNAWWQCDIVSQFIHYPIHRFWKLNCKLCSRCKRQVAHLINKSCIEYSYQFELVNEFQSIIIKIYWNRSKCLDSPFSLLNIFFYFIRNALISSGQCTTSRFVYLYHWSFAHATFK